MATVFSPRRRSGSWDRALERTLVPPRARPCRPSPRPPSRRRASTLTCRRMGTALMDRRPTTTRQEFTTTTEDFGVSRFCFSSSSSRTRSEDASVIILSGIYAKTHRPEGSTNFSLDYFHFTSDNSRSHLTHTNILLLLITTK